MTVAKDLKRIVRSRMKKTGESYTAARLQVVKKKEEPKPDYAALSGMSDASVKKNTGRDWAEWVEILDRAGAASMKHPDIARHVSSLGVRDWWTQSVTVGYERIRGLRAIGQRRSGQWEANKSRTFAVSVDTLFAAFTSPAKRKKWLGEKITIRSTNPPKAIYITWPDGSSVAVGFTPKGNAKSSVAIQHGKLASKEDADRMKVLWSERFDALAEIL